MSKEIVRQAPSHEYVVDAHPTTEVVVAVPTIWSDYQLALFDNIANGIGHTVVKAVAGSGKSTSILECLKYLPPGLDTLFVAFNKPIAASLAEKILKLGLLRVKACTLHSYGSGIVRRSFRDLQFNGDRVLSLFDLGNKAGVLKFRQAVIEIAKNLDPKMKPESAFTFDMKKDIIKAVSLAKGQLAGDGAKVEKIIDDFEIESARRSPVPGIILPKEIENALLKAFVDDVLALLVRCANLTDGQFDYDDMIWLPVVLDLPQTKYDRVFVDETQDLNPVQIELVMRAIKPNGRICAVGDPKQAIYGFRGADEYAVENVVKRLEATILPLSVCYRCSKAVIREAKKFVPDIEHAPNAEEGSVSKASMKEMLRNAKPGQFILSRANAPLVSLCMQFLKEGRPAMIKGRDIGSSLASFVQKSAAPGVPELIDYVEAWRDVEIQRLTAKRRDTTNVEDRAECIIAIADGALTVHEVISRIEKLFVDKDDETKFIVLSSTHKAKGLEREQVWLLQSTYMRREGSEEENLYYVAVTRAQKNLFLVQEELREKGE